MNSASNAKTLDDIRAFIVQACSSKRPKGMRAFAFTLFQKSDKEGTIPHGQDFLGEKQADLDSLSDSEREERATAMAQKFLSSAETLVSVERQPQVFKVSAYASTAAQAYPVESHPFRVDPDLSSLEGFTENPDSRGMASQTMRGFESSQKELTRRTSDFFQAMDRNQRVMLDFCDLVGRRNQHLEDNQAALAEKYQAALDNSMARITEANIKILEANRTERHVGMLEEVAQQLIPVIIAALKERAGRGPMISFIKRMKPDHLKVVWEMVRAEGSEEDKRLFAEVLQTANLLPSPEPPKVTVGSIPFEKAPPKEKQQ